MKRCVIVGGAPIENYNFIRSHFKKDDFFIFCDGGLNHVSKLSVTPDLIIGDFDSHEKPETSIETIRLPCEKDDTDTVYAVKEAVGRNFDEFLLVGVIGKRFDHSFGNISLLLSLHRAGLTATIVDDFSEMQIVAKDTVFIDASCKYFSLLNISGIAKEIDVKNAKYPLSCAEIKSDYQYGISNEVEKGAVAEVRVGIGECLLLKVFGE